MAGTSETAFWEQDGMYMSPIAGEAITLGQVVEIATTDDYVTIAGDGAAKVLGVAIAGYRTSRTATDNVIATGNRVTVATRGVVNVTVGTGTVTRGELVQSYTAGTVQTLTLTDYTDVRQIVGMALTSSTVTVKVKLMRG
jgi:hypothetical protein